MSPDQERIQTIYQRLKPAQDTLNYMRKNDDNMAQLTTNFRLMQKDIQNICEKLETNTEEHKAILTKIDSLQKFMYMVMGALIILQFILKFFTNI
jgi:predicted  nucleic acid-binding Zn-ribbon protein